MNSSMLKSKIDRKLFAIFMKQDTIFQIPFLVYYL